MIKIIDYGIGNIQAFLNVYKRLGISADVARSVDDIESATHLVLPGVGAFDQAMALFNDSGLREGIEKRVFEERIPIIGICVGMQMLATSSEEGNTSGLGWIPGQVRTFSSNIASKNLPMPHMGWNSINKRKNTLLLKDFEETPSFYFLHSFYYECDDVDDVLATAEYGHNFHCIVGRNNIFGIQCHPEKSHSSGYQLLKNFAEI
ncbi:imidazole glycerol phosphate synthase subunit HisH [Salmonella enterica subsp. enterica serovar Teshie]|nr:imidazole glycerol phosphate synthase subunit HisH [Salmonella enterica subsp. enterica serovar Teshie]EBU9729162.1 imidazole glycerol phosphate synthase subunit HisH [Salmonella enterica subsp. enterica serovar Teshie]EBV3611370.1 imidazole glycerol phosphate synthase subunit HisH [Salmonella enterica subsp. enterica serovar Teshie]ECB5045370.1 imidazole glycerol phosphate synthase subunit HisH [Salmonella enterica subsp. enterica serovar Teshie]ECD2691380.1 imidazole glycerol phosphate syn